jgi:photosystem II stability/assembly factor-like uncharacterized protein
MPLLSGLALLLATQGTLPVAVPYRWKSVQIVGAGFIDGIVFHPTAKDVRYARTDMGGAYRWDTGEGRWMPILDWVPYADLNLMGVESIAVDPTDAKKVYLACGTYTNATTPDGAILRSDDGGRTFAITRVPFKFGGNENGRGNGERMTVDSNDPKRLLLGTRRDGLWRSDDGAVTWRRVDSFPATGGTRGEGIVVTLFDPSSGTSGQGSKVEYAAVSDLSGPTLYRTEDGGTNWSSVAGAPTGLVPTHMVRDDAGALWLTYGSSPGPSGMTTGAVWKYKDGAWTDVTPDKPDANRRFGYAAVSVVKGAAIVSSFYRPGGEQIFRSTDGGVTWRSTIGGKETYDYSKAPFIARTGIHWLFDIEIDPFDPNHAVFTTGYGGHETFDLTNADHGKPVHWSALATGIEESVALTLASPTKGAHLLSGIGDYGSFTHWNLDQPAPEGAGTTPRFSNTTSIGVGDFAPGTIVRVGHSAGNSGEASLGFSMDEGRSWRPPISTPPNARDGSIAVSSDGRNWVWTLRSGSYRTSNYGSTWTKCEDLPTGLRVTADAVSPNRFYALDLFNDRLYLSSNGGASFTERDLALPGGPPKQGGDRGDSRGGQDQLYSTPGRSGDLWVAAYDGLYHAAPAKAFVKVPGVEQLHAFGFGRPAQEHGTPALYMVGTINGLRGIFRSDDSGTSWVRINDDAHQWGLVLQITGDPKQYGRVYVGTHGRGIFYGDPK